ncbi:RING finger protein 37 isoform X2 [Polyodon spathula]|nr:RING finger protein 37 isoform X2 [Polyodon spathula]XP_041109436.1 RING finger protein 37 isoform X2 [Polyodon spathula]XP_041109445.1 RING finger protein 37 isoform X2 [Polyodon spathula]XP_041109452.1 RING finger protein 37 isoform X2 [Polyodon spathula]
MVINLCLPHFRPSIYCNKVCADGYEVSNLISEDLSLRRRGFRAEYFIRPPVHITLSFPFRTEIRRVDVDMMTGVTDRGQTSRGLEIFTSSTSCKPVSDSPESGSWNSPAFSDKDIFTLLGKAVLKEHCQASFSHRGYRHRPPFHSGDPPALDCSLVQHQELWSKGPASLSSVTHLRICLSHTGGSCPMGLRKLEVWGQPSRSCSQDVIDRVLKAHLESQRTVPALLCLPLPPATVQPLEANGTSDIPEEFIDPITQEVMTLPLLLPSGKVVDQSTMEEYERREAGWGRPPNDPFTGVPFSRHSKLLPHPSLKTRIDRFLLQLGDRQAMAVGVLGRATLSALPRPSRLISVSAAASSEKRKNEPVEESGLPATKDFRNPIASECKVSPRDSTCLPVCVAPLGRTASSRYTVNDKASRNPRHFTTSNKLKRLTASRDSESHSETSSGGCEDTLSSGALALPRKEPATPSAYTHPETQPASRDCALATSQDLGLPDLAAADPNSSSASERPSKRLRTERASSFSQIPPSSGPSSHEQRLSESLDVALTSALRNLPSFTTQLGVDRPMPRVCEGTSSYSRTSPDHGAAVAGGHNCCCSCSQTLSVYSLSTAVFQLPCAHLLCRPCLSQKHAHQSVYCPSCGVTVPAQDVTRVYF